LRAYNCLARHLTAEATRALIVQVIETPAVQALARRLEKGGALAVSGVSVSAQPFLAALVRHWFPQRPVVVINDSLKTQEWVHQDLLTWLGSGPGAASDPAEVAPPLFYPSWEILPQDSRLPHVDVISERLETLVALTGSAAARPSPAPLIVTSVVALVQRTFPPGFLREHSRRVIPGDRVDPLDLVEWLEDQGYEPEAKVTQKGELALRGGILDVFPLTSPWPVRIEFFGDEIESLRQFDPVTQTSREAITEAVIPPAGELGLLKKQLADQGLGTLLDHLPGDAILLLNEPESLDSRADEYASQAIAGDPFLERWDEFKAAAVARGMAVVALAETSPETASESPVEPTDTVLLSFLSLDAFRPISERLPDPQVAEAQRREFLGQLHRWLRQGFEVHVYFNNAGERQRFGEVWEEQGLGVTASADGPPQGPAALVPRSHLGTIARGFICEPARLVVVTDAEIFGRYKVQRPRRLKSPHAQAVRSALDIDFTDLEEGDFVVHLQHGIGRYQGLQVLPAGAGGKATTGATAIAGSGQECLVIEYAPFDSSQPPPRLYVPVTEAHLVSKYVGTGKARPPLNTLGGTRWAKAKAQAERAVRDVASELLSIQAARESQAGHPFKADAPWQREFESSFVYEETPDQMRAILEAKADMERPKPMDRLICGDVGFGKTEVGIRAAFKAVMDGKQVAILVPTTVLAQQHYNTFRERMADYPVRVELLSRFRTRRAQQRVVQDLATGSVDIVIGTHRLIQSDVAFKDLGLVVIDEEQRFGVLHKEKFKMLRKLVDVLTLSATPIPRTLYLALTGARDMSTIQTPPHDRLPVETIVTQYDERLIRDAIQRELNRGGQVFFLHNRVATIGAMAQKLAALLPHARILVGHGQMDSDELEEVMTAFVNGEADILLSTTIIESGLDIPNANTIIIDRADRFGLSDLYQLRGRVGRYKHQAYAYLLLPRHASLLNDVRKRLSAIKQYSTLGSGFKIAMRDLEIRGAGNLLGAEQSGHITAVGFDLYCQLLKQSVSALKGEKVKPRLEVQVRLDFLPLSPGDAPASDNVKSTEPGEQPLLVLPDHAAIPYTYIADPRQRIEIYRKLAQANDTESLKTLQAELRDRFGPPPPAVERLVQVGELKILAGERGIDSIEVRDDKLMFTRFGELVMVGNRFPRLTKTGAAARLREIRKLILSLAPVNPLAPGKKDAQPSR